MGGGLYSITSVVKMNSKKNYLSRIRSIISTESQDNEDERTGCSSLCKLDLKDALDRGCHQGISQQKLVSHDYSTK